MKKIMILSALMLFVGTALMAQNKGVTFETGTLSQTLEKAAKEKKMVFVDVYTTWCGPCKLVAEKVFPVAKVGDYFNKTFVNAKFDAEKGEGIKVAEKYSVSGYPTFLILDSNGKEVGRLVGANGDPDAFIERTKKAVADIKKGIPVKPN